MANFPLFGVLGELRTEMKHGADISRENMSDACWFPVTTAHVASGRPILWRVSSAVRR